MERYEAGKAAFFRGLAELLNIRLEDLSSDIPLNNENWDSIAVISAIGLIDREFGLTIPTSELSACQSSGSVIQLVKSAVERTGAQ